MDIDLRYSRESLWMSGILGFFIGLIVGVISKGLALFLIMGMFIFYAVTERESRPKARIVKTRGRRGKHQP